MKKFLSTVDPVLRHPLFTALASIFIGSLVVNIIIQNRSKADATFQYKVELLEETGTKLNAVLSREYGIIASEAVDKNDVNGLDSLIGLLYTGRMTLKIKSKAYLGNEDFYNDYQDVLFELDDIDAALGKLQENKFDTLTEVSNIKNEIDTLQKKWNIAPVPDADYHTPYRELNTWAGMVWDKTEKLISDELDKALK